jgi:CpeT protein
MTMLRIMPFVALQMACASVEQDSASGQELERQEFDPVAQLAVMLSGEFDSSAQAAEMNSYYNVHLWGCAAEAPQLDGVALYIEQALSTDQGSPYRQRLYLLSELELGENGESRARSEIYKFISPSSLIGSCAEGVVPTFDVSDLELRDGCEVDLIWTGDSFEGGTEGHDCSSTNGGDYSVSDIELFDDRIESWDRGYYDSGVQAWGSTAGPYIFDRIDD